MGDAATSRDDDMTTSPRDKGAASRQVEGAGSPRDDTASSQQDGGVSRPHDTAGRSPQPAQPAAEAPQLFELRLPHPVRALAISAAAAVAGAVVIVLSSHPAVTALGAIFLGFGVLLASAALVLTARLRSTVRLTASGLEVSRGGRTGSLAWTDIERVQERGHRLIAVARERGQDLVITVPGPRAASYARLLQGIKQHLDDSRGYGS